MDILRKVLYTVTFPIWFVLSLLAGSKERPPAIADSTDEKYPLPPIEKFDPDQLENAGTDQRDIVQAFGQDLEPAQYIDDVRLIVQLRLKGKENKNLLNMDEHPRLRGTTFQEDEEDGQEEEEDDEEEISDEGGEDGSIPQESPGYRLPDSMKQATDSLQREIEETMKLRDELIAAADRNLQRVEAVSKNSHRAAEETTQKASTIVGNIARGLTAATGVVRETATGAARSAQEEFGRSPGDSEAIVPTIAVDMVQNPTRSTQDAFGSVPKAANDSVGDQKQMNSETLERMKAVEQAMKEDPQRD
ncbi:uncharacterized protein LOC114828478 [Galendromus occidentalis]|uniref:Uncharacterized protein LOC114828478 n=1 Tax=Galendromus occidentalis TaxID=34638 RepID=A0AAJ7SID8_9ACAR|nr:uncharacterized protein LOC114828478 [Galendromus occidentalis]